MKLVKGNKEAGFSLVELMVVVAIIGILASVALPKLQIFMAKARQSEGVGVIGMIHTLQGSYKDDPNSQTPGLYGATAALIGYAHTAKYWNAPAFTTGGTAAAPTYTASITNSVLLCPGVAVGANTIRGNENGPQPVTTPACQ